MTSVYTQAIVRGILSDDMARRRGQRTGYVYRRGDSWFGQFRVDTAELDAKGKFKRKTLTKFIAPAAGPGKIGKKQAMREFYEMYLKNLHKSTPLSTRTVGEFVAECFRPHVILRCKPSGAAHYEGMLKNHVLPALGEFFLRDVGAQHVYNLVKAKLDAKLSVQTVTHIRNTVTAVFRHAKRLQAYSGDLPTEGVKLPALVHAERKTLTWNQVQALAAALPEQIGALVVVLALTGLRVGEAMGLRWKHVDFQNGVLDVQENFVRGRYGTVKTTGSQAEVPLHSLALAALLKVQALSLWRGPDDPVFVGTKSGRPLDHHNVSNRFLKPAGKAIGCPWISWHVLRHTFSTLAHEVGMSIEQRRKVLRHTTDKMTMRYTHPELEGIRLAIEKIGKETVN